MPRFALTLLLCLLAGIILNFAVAAALALRPHRYVPTMAFGFRSASGAQCNLQWHGDFGRDAISMWMQHPAPPQGIPLFEWRAGFRSIFNRADPNSLTLADFRIWNARLFPGWLEGAFDPPGHDEWRAIYASGWPMRSVFGIGLRPRIAGSVLTRGIITRDPYPSIRALGYFLLPVGTVVNSIVFALPFAFFAFAVPVLRRRSRLRRGRCLDCNYDLRGELSAGCPECGWNRPASATPADTS